MCLCIDANIHIYILCVAVYAYKLRGWGGFYARDKGIVVYGLHWKLKMVFWIRNRMHINFGSLNFRCSIGTPLIEVYICIYTNICTWMKWLNDWESAAVHRLREQSVCISKYVDRTSVDGKMPRLNKDTGKWDCPPNK